MFDATTSPTIIINNSNPVDPVTAEQRGDFLTAVYVGIITAAILFPGLNQSVQNTLGILVRGGTVGGTTQGTTQGTNNQTITVNDSEVGAKAIGLMKSKNYKIDSDMNIVFLRHFYCKDFDKFCDRQLVIDGTGKTLYDGKSSTLPGAPYYDKPANPSGTFAIETGQYSSWQVGTHYGLTGRFVHEALVQTKPIDGTRAFKKDRSDSKPVNGTFGINIHGSGSGSNVNVGSYSAGCLVADSMDNHKKFMATIKKFNKGTYTATVLEWK